MTDRQQRFVAEYLVDFNATRAAIRAGYSRRIARQIGSENLSKPDIRRAVGEQLAKFASEALVSKAWIVNKLLAVYHLASERADSVHTGKRHWASTAVRSLELIAKTIGAFDVPPPQTAAVVVVQSDESGFFGISRSTA